MEKVSLNDTPSEKIYLKLNKKAIDFLLDKIKKENVNLFSPIELYRFKIGKKVSINFIKKISKNLGLKISYFEKNMELITSCKNTNIGIKNPKFPINFNTKEGIRLISGIIGDGEINNQLQPGYNNQDKKLIEIILKSFQQVFGKIDYKIYLRPDKTYQLHFPKIAGLILLKIGMKPGYKSITNYGIPRFIFNTSKKKKSVFIKQFFNDEGNVRLKDRRLQVKQTLKINKDKKEMRLNPEKYAHQVLVDTQKLLSSLGIKSKIHLGNYRADEKKADWELDIYCKENLEKFQKYIGFDLDYKNNLLDKAIKSYKFPSAPRNGRINFALNHYQKVQDRYGFVTKYLLAKESKRSARTTICFLMDLEKRKLIKKIERPRDKLGHPKAVKYSLV